MAIKVGMMPSNPHTTRAGNGTPKYIACRAIPLNVSCSVSMFSFIGFIKFPFQGGRIEF
jgi:hypothetical protein